MRSNLLKKDSLKKIKNLYSWVRKFNFLQDNFKCVVRMNQNVLNIYLPQLLK